MEEVVKLSTLRDRLAVLQRQVIALQIPVVVLVDGWENSGKGDLINALSYELDPRYYSVAIFDDEWATDQQHHYLIRFWDYLPKKGHITFYDRSPYFKVFNDYNSSLEKINGVLEDINGFHRMLADDGTIVIKLFLDISPKEQKKRLHKLEDIPLKRLFLQKLDYRQIEKYDKFKAHFDDIIERTDYIYGRWHVINMDDIKAGSRLALQEVIEEVENGIKTFISTKELNEKSAQEANNQSEASIPSYPSAFPENLFVPVDETTYKEKLKKYQKRARLLAFMLYICQIPTICAFEGNDAAGKGGTIKRLTKDIDPRGYDIYQTAAPTKEELSYHYMRRFMVNFPPYGKMAIFDRTWYGRVLVERIEGFATPREWNRAYQEINDMEENLIHSGVNFMKFFLAIDKDEQLKRFQKRQNTPEKRYKITDEDWRNRDKWDVYENVFQEMFYRTSRATTPWHIIEGNNKKYERLAVLKIFVNQSASMLKEYGEKHADKLDWSEFWKEYDSIK